MSKRNPTTLSDRLRKLADEIDEATAKKEPKTQEELCEDLARTIGPSLKARLIARRKKGSGDHDSDGDEDGDQGGGGAGAGMTLTPHKKPKR